MNETTLEGYEIHPVAAIFPVLPNDELQQLADDIRTNGQQQPIMRDANGVIIDGRNRLLACVRAGVEPRFADLPADADPVAYILSANVQRRHMNQGQRAMALAKAQTFSSGKFQRKGAVAKSMGLSGAHLSRAITVLEHAPELVDDVLSDVVSLTEAYAIARARKAAVVDRPPMTLEEAETHIDRGLKVLAQLGVLLLSFRARKGHRALGYDDFDDYLEQEICNRDDVYAWEEQIDASCPHILRVTMETAVERHEWPTTAEDLSRRAKEAEQREAEAIRVGDVQWSEHERILAHLYRTVVK